MKNKIFGYGLLIVVILVIFLIFRACSGGRPPVNKDAVLDLNYRGNVVDIESSSLYTAKNYEKKANLILERGKKRLKERLPNLIYDQVEVYRTLLNEINEQAILNYSYSDTQFEINKIRQVGTYQLQESEIKINQVYYEIVNELLVLNDDYYNHFQELEEEVDFEDYYNVSPFSLSKEVNDEINDLIKAENKRVEKEKIDNIKTVGVVGLEIAVAVVGTPATLALIKTGAHIAVKGVQASVKSGKTARLTSKILNKKLAKHFAKALSNNEKRIKVARQLDKVQFIDPLYEGGKVGLNLVTGYQVGKTIDYFKSADNKIEGSIGTLSNGIITQPIANLGLMVERNKNRI